MPLGVTPSDNATTNFQVAYNAVFPTQSSATDVGTLVGDSTDLNVLGQVTGNVSKNVYKFNFQSGDTIKADFNNLTGTSTLRLQLFDSAGNLIADSSGTATQQTAFAQLNSSSGLAVSNGQYYAQVSYAPNAKTDPQDYNFQLYSGTTYNNTIVTSAQIQAYDPNLFTSATNSVSPSGSVQAYSQTSTFAASQSPSSALGLGDLVSNQTELAANSTLTNASAAQYYNFNFQQGSAIKFALNNSTSNGPVGNLRAQLFDKGGNVVADNYGTDAQQQAFIQLSSGEGLAASTGNYTIKISAGDGQALTAPQSYDFQLYSGIQYAETYQTTAIQPSTSGSFTDGTNLNVFASSNAVLNTRSAFNTIGATASGATNIGWLAENKTKLSVLSQLTSADQTEYYGFTFQQGSAIKFDFANSTNTSNLRVQLMDISGSHVIADNYGTDAQKKAYGQLTSSGSLPLNNGQYTVKVSFAPDATHTTQTYNFDIYSGTKYTEQDKTTASAQTLQNVLLGGGSVGGYNAGSAAASYLNQLSNGATTDIIGALSGSA